VRPRLLVSIVVPRTGSNKPSSFWKKRKCATEQYTLSEKKWRNYSNAMKILSKKAWSLGCFTGQKWRKSF